jgi:ABC-type amino acid transport substrate-binding protein
VPTDAIDPELTPDGRYVVIRGRRWRATDPDLPPDVSEVLRRELMSARRAVGAALRAGDPDAERAARDRVQRAKVALGERGTPWWEQSDDERRERWERVVRILEP